MPSCSPISNPNTLVETEVVDTPTTAGETFATTSGIFILLIGLIFVVVPPLFVFDLASLIADCIVPLIAP